MADFIWFLLVVLTLAVASYQRTSLVTAVAMGAGVMILGTLFGDIGLLGWVVFLALTLPFTLANIRQQHISKKLLAFYRKVMPEMSSTEQEAIDAGTVWWDGDIFSGKPDWDSNKRETFAWFAPSLNYTLVRLQQFKEGDEQGDIKLKSFETQ